MSDMSMSTTSRAWAGRTPTADEWRGILEAHAQWLRGAWVDAFLATMRAAFGPQASA